MNFLIPSFADIIDILFVAYLLYKIIIIFKERGGYQILLGLGIVVFLYFVASILNLRMTSSFLKIIKDYWAIAFLILFQNETRVFLAKMIKNSNSLFNLKKHKNTPSNIYEELLVAINIMSLRHIGALIVIEGDYKLDDMISGKGTIIDAELSAKLILTIFNTRAPLHDGAIIIRNSKLYAVKVTLPLTDSEDKSKHLGTRHQAGLGLSEKTDAFVIIISEESGEISYAKEGKIHSKLSLDELSQKLKDVI